MSKNSRAIQWPAKRASEYSVSGILMHRHRCGCPTSDVTQALTTRVVIRHPINRFRSRA